MSHHSSQYPPPHTERPIILIPCRRADSVADPDLDTIPVKNDLCLVTYTKAIVKAGGLPLLLPCVEGDPEEVYASAMRMASGLLIPGGCDVSPQEYGEVAESAKLGHLYKEVDILDLFLVQQADKLRIPTLGICRGMQIMNIQRGGTLLQDLGQYKAAHELHHLPRTHISHSLQLSPHTLLESIFKGEEALANSLHHQAVKDVGENLVISARCSDTGVIEAIEDSNTSRFFVGIQCHPEELCESVGGWARLFKAFIDEAKSYKNLSRESIISREG